MTTERLRLDDPCLARRLEETLDRGGVIVFPTDTLYGLGGDPWSEAASRVREIKGRTKDQPFSLHLPCCAVIRDFAVVDADAATWIEQWLPGPYTVLLPARDSAPPCSVSRGVVGLRVPDHPLFLEILQRPVFGTSANRHGDPALVSLDEIEAAIPELDLAIVGDRPRGRASAVIDLTGSTPRAVRGQLPGTAS
jgi:L-threonylcarbamoyladenylate synthase